MTYKETLPKLIDLIETQENALESLISAQDRERSGDPAHWAPKEVLAHIAGWTRRSVENMQLIQRGEEPVNYDQYLELNDQDFLRYRELTWEQCLEQSRLARQAVRELLDELSEDELLASGRGRSGDERAIWERVIGNAVEHPMFHLSMVLDQFGEAEASTSLHENMARELIQLKPGDIDWQGRTQYNLACHYALSGQNARALELLKTALELAPRLVEWSRQDSDLDGLRGEPAYLEIVQGGEAV